jgi:hypothetical protein
MGLKCAAKQSKEKKRKEKKRKEKKRKEKPLMCRFFMLFSIHFKRVPWPAMLFLCLFRYLPPVGAATLLAYGSGGVEGEGAFGKKT